MADKEKTAKTGQEKGLYFLKIIHGITEQKS